jgi:hypothetical protein
VPSIPPEVEEIIMRCLAKNAEQRFQSMDAVATALSAVEDPLEQTAGPLTIEAVRATPRAWAPPKEPPPAEERVPRVVATERLGSGSGEAAQSYAAASMSRRGGTQPVAPAPSPLQITPSAASSATDRSPTKPLDPPTGSRPYKAFFVLGFGLGIVGACAIAYLAITHFESEPTTPTVVIPDEPDPAAHSDARPEPEPQAQPEPEPHAEPQAQPEPEPDPEPEAEETPTAEADLAVSAPEDTSARGRRQRRQRNHAAEGTQTPAHEPATTHKDPERKPKGKEKDAGEDVHPDLRDPYGTKK